MACPVKTRVSTLDTLVSLFSVWQRQQLHRYDHKATICDIPIKPKGGFQPNGGTRTSYIESHVGGIAVISNYLALVAAENHRLCLVTQVPCANSNLGSLIARFPSPKSSKYRRLIYMHNLKQDRTSQITPKS
jgi:hypothetical protein